MKQMSVEHGIVDISGLPAGTQQISVGDVLSFIPTNGEMTYAVCDLCCVCARARVCVCH